jgi:inosine/xanthosine triphosphate pyrophosphatase family protein
MEGKKKIPLTFITGNKKKLEEFLAIMSDELGQYYEVTNKEIDRTSIL